MGAIKIRAHCCLPAGGVCGSGSIECGNRNSMLDRVAKMRKNKQVEQEKFTRPCGDHSPTAAEAADA